MSEISSNNQELKNLRTLRQAFIFASILILAGVGLSYVVHPYFIALPVLVAGGLMFSGTIGWCPMIHILERMPWNK